MALQLQIVLTTIYPIKYAHGFVVLWFALIKYLKQRTLTTMVDIQQVKMQIYVGHTYVVVIYFPVDSCDVFSHVFFRLASLALCVRWG